MGNAIDLGSISSNQHTLAVVALFGLHAPGSTVARLVVDVDPLHAFIHPPIGALWWRKADSDGYPTI